MNRQKVLKVLNVVMLVDFLGLVTTVLLNDTLPRNVFYKIHPLFGSILLLLIIVHLVLNWNWIKTSYRKKG